MDVDSRTLSFLTVRSVGFGAREMAINRQLANGRSDPSTFSWVRLGNFFFSCKVDPDGPLQATDHGTEGLR